MYSLTFVYFRVLYSLKYAKCSLPPQFHKVIASSENVLKFPKPLSASKQFYLICSHSTALG